MARRLKATFRWAVSGTPLARGLGDLHGLLTFLGAEPYTSKAVMDSILNSAEKGKPKSRLQKIDT
jgi:E3 ubiquitin-protein ligase SHPRH